MVVIQVVGRSRLIVGAKIIPILVPGAVAQASLALVKKILTDGTTLRLVVVGVAMITQARGAVLKLLVIGIVASGRLLEMITLT